MLLWASISYFYWAIDFGFLASSAALACSGDTTSGSGA